MVSWACQQSGIKLTWKGGIADLVKSQNNVQAIRERGEESRSVCSRRIDRRIDELHIHQLSLHFRLMLVLTSPWTKGVTTSSRPTMSIMFRIMSPLRPGV